MTEQKLPHRIGDLESMQAARVAICKLPHRIGDLEIKLIRHIARD